ncbi:MAG TPA: GatB/YqeY domain-containing protein [Candidatus Marinimicrobia bacterium]|nr:GatB/YqeY domain-containing protein [Candidatus Neomarinimicrobiota bacterium]HIB52867.1 GatB/YqeY domain-containing protein [Candidatus Neomarinimicrobiota bacterium]
MPLVDKIQKDMYKAMKEKEKERINALRNIIGKLKYRYIDKGDKLTEQEEIKVIQSLAKQRRESIEMYKQGGRNDLVETETKELSIIEEYLPQAMSEEEVRRLVRETVKETGAESMSDLGKVMPLVMKKGAGKVDGKLAQEVLRELLS